MCNVRGFSGEGIFSSAWLRGISSPVSRFLTVTCSRISCRDTDINVQEIRTHVYRQFDPITAVVVLFLEFIGRQRRANFREYRFTIVCDSLVRTPLVINAGQRANLRSMEKNLLIQKRWKKTPLICHAQHTTRSSFKLRFLKRARGNHECESSEITKTQR